MEKPAKIYVGNFKKIANYNAFKGYINLSKIPKEHITRNKNGDAIVKIAGWYNNEPDQYGNDGAIQVDTYKKPEDQTQAAPASTAKAKPSPVKPVQQIDDLPF